MERNSNGNIKRMGDDFWNGCDPEWSKKKSKNPSIFPIKVDNDLSNRLKTLETSNSKLTSDNLDLRSEIKKRDVEIARIKNENKDLMIENNFKTNRILTIENVLKNLQSNVDTKNALIESLENSIKLKEQKFKKFGEENDIVIESLEDSIKLKDQKYKKLQEENEDLIDKLDNLTILKNRIIQDLEEKINLHKIEIEKWLKLKDDNDKLVKDLESLSERTKNFEEKSKALTELEAELKKIIQKQLEPEIKKEQLKTNISELISGMRGKLSLISKLNEGDTISPTNMTILNHSSWSTSFLRRWYGEDRVQLLDWLEEIFDEIISINNEITGKELRNKLACLLLEMNDANENLKKLKETYNSDNVFKDRIDTIYNKNLDFFEILNKNIE